MTLPHNIAKHSAYIFVVAVFLYINIIFILRYISRISHEAAVLSAIIYAGAIMGLWILRKREVLSETKIIPIISITLLLSIGIIGFSILPVESIRVDRWEMIDIFWKAIYDGEYPYLQTGRWCAPAGMPFYFILCFPFWIIGEIGWATILSVATSIFIACKYSHSSKTATFISILLASAPFIYFEMLARSTIFFNTIIFWIYFVWLLDNDLFSNRKSFLFSALIGGLILSTRGVYAIPLIILVIFKWRENLSGFFRILLWGVILLFTFTITIVPFAFIYPDEFNTMNPLLLQSSGIIPFNATIIFVLLAVITAIICTNKNQVMFASGFMLFAIITWWLFSAMQGSLYNIIFSNADISYYIFCIPFFVTSILHRYDPQ